MAPGGDGAEQRRGILNRAQREEKRQEHTQRERGAETRRAHLLAVQQIGVRDHTRRHEHVLRAKRLPRAIAALHIHFKAGLAVPRMHLQGSKREGAGISE